MNPSPSPIRERPSRGHAHLVIPRSPAGSRVATGVGLVLHFLLCLPATASRGYPAINPFWESTALYLILPWCAVYVLLDDDRRVRRGNRLLFAITVSLITGAAQFNIGSATPRIGHLVGVPAIYIECALPIALYGLYQLIFIGPACWIIDEAFTQLWSRVRAFRDGDARTARFQFSLAALGVCLTVIPLVIPAVVKTHDLQGRDLARYQQTYYNLRSILIAMQNYQEVYGTFPPAYVSDRRGKPMHSWRVLLLSFLDEKPLYEKYRLHEAWDSPHNRALASRTPETYVSNYPRVRREGNTGFVAITGQGTAFPPGKTVRLRDVRDGTSNTIILVNWPVAEITWTAPVDLPIAEIGRLLEPGGDLQAKPDRQKPRGFYAGYVDGTTQWFAATTSLEELQSLARIDDAVQAASASK